MFFRSFVLFFLFSLSTFLLAQDISGSLEGLVTDSLNNPLPGVNITVQSDNLQGLKGAATNEKGYFGIFYLPVGNYRVKVSMIGFRELIIENVQVRLGKTTYLGNLILSPEAINLPDVTVLGDKNIIDPTTTTYGGNLQPKYFDQFPVNRDYKSIVTLLPQVNTSFFGDEANIGGATGYENKYFVDGVEVNDPGFGIFSTYLPYNFINEVELKAGGYDAQYQSALGGLMNVVTKSGTNDLHGSVFGFYTSNTFTANKELGLLDPTQGDFSDYDFGFSLGGPILMDKLWFFTAYNPTFANHEVSIPDFGIGIDKTVRHSFAGKLNWLASQQLRFNMTITGDPTTRDAVGRNIIDPPSGLGNPDVYLQDITEGGYNLSLNGVYTINQNIILDGLLAKVYRHDTGSPATERGNEIRYDDRTSNTLAGGVGGTWDSPRYTNTARVVATISSPTHLSTIGIQYKVSVDYGHYEYHNIIKLNDSTYQENYGAGLPSTTSQRLPSFFIQDEWTVTRKIRFSAGLRWDGQYVVGSNNKVDQTITIPLQPRIGLTFIPDNEGRNKIFASFGRYAQELNLSVIGGYYDDQGYDTTIFYPQDPRMSRDGGIIADWSGQNFIHDEIVNLEGQYYDEFSLGYERLLWNNFKFSVQGLYRTLGQAIDDAYVLSQNTFRLGNPGKYPLQDRPEAMRDYSALIISIERRGDEHFNFLASYVLSRDYGNYEGLFDAFYHSEFSNQNFSFDNPFEQNFITGLVPNDRTHVFKFSGSYKFSFELNAGISFILESGTPLSDFAIGTYDTGLRFLSQRGSAGRTPTVWDLGARFTYDLPTVNLFQSRLIIDLFHIASQQEPVDINQFHYWEIDENGNPSRPNSEYGQAYRYQQPMSMRLGMEINF